MNIEAASVHREIDPCAADIRFYDLAKNKSSSRRGRVFHPNQF